MKNHRVLAWIVGLASAYLVVHAVMLGYAFYLVHDLSRSGGALDDPYVVAARESHERFLIVFLIAAVLAALTTVSFGGLLGRQVWARFLWLGTSISIIASIFSGAVWFGADWTRQLFLLFVVTASWWYWASSAERAHAG
jgi:hypothetical protein